MLYYIFYVIFLSNKIAARTMKKPNTINAKSPVIFTSGINITVEASDDTRVILNPRATNVRYLYTSLLFGSRDIIFPTIAIRNERNIT